MADIRNDQYLHRPGAGRGAITPADPLEARLYDGAGQPIAPATEGKQDSIIAALNTLATTLGTEATLGLLKAALDTISGKVATQTTLAALEAKAATAAKQDAAQATLAQLLTVLTAIRDTAGIKRIVDAVDISDRANRQLGQVLLHGPDGQPIGVQDDALKVALSGQKAAQTILPRAIRAAGTSEYRRIVTPPIGAKGCRLELSVFGVTGQFGSGEGISLLYREHTDAIPTALVNPYETTKTIGTGNGNQHLIMVYPGLSPGLSEENGGVFGGNFLKVDGVLGRRLVVQVNINGTFAPGEGFDCQLDVVWIM